MKRNHYFNIFNCFSNPFSIFIIIILSILPIQSILAQCSPSVDCNQIFTTLSANKVSLINSGGLTLSNMNIEINGTFTVDRNLTLNNCRIKMGKNAKITTVGAVQLTMSCNRFFNCNNELWDRIHISKNCRMYINNNFFHDANVAIYFEPGYRVPTFKILPSLPTIQYVNQIINNTFDRNVVGIETGTKVVFNPCNFIGNLFDKSVSTPNIINPVGIKFTNTFATLGSQASANTFQRLSIGFLMDNSSVKLSNFIFENMRGFAPNQTNNRASGIVATESTLDISQSNFRYNNYAGIVSDRAKNLKTQNCTFESGDVFQSEQRYGVRVINTLPNGNIEINDNAFEAKAFVISCIYIEKTPSNEASKLSQNSIFRNTIILMGNGIGGEGITVKVNKNSYNNILQISSNTINISHPPGGESTGIRVSGISELVCRGLQILHNDMYFTYLGNLISQSSQWGIGCEMLDPGGIETEHPMANIIHSNKVSVLNIKNEMVINNPYSNSNSVVMCAIHVNNCPNMQITDNETDKSQNGFHLAGNMRHCDFSCNVMNKHVNGLLCDNKNHLDDQINQVNQWSIDLADYFFSAAYYTNTAFQPAPPPYIFTVKKNAQLVGRTLWPPSIVASTEWFVNDNNGEIDCISGIPPGTPNNDLGGYDTNIVNEVLPTPLGADAWNDRRRLAMRLTMTPNLMSNNQSAFTWYNNSTGSSYKAFADAALSLSGAWNPGNTLSNAFISSLGKLDSINIYLQSLSAQIQQSPEDTVLINHFNLTSFVWDSLNYQTDSLFDLMQLQITLNFQNLNPQLDALPEGTIHEKNMKYIFKHMRFVAMGGEVLEAKLDSLLFIASQCKILGGDAVYMALQFLPKDMAAPYLNDPQTPCNAMRPANSNMEKILMDVKISPLPADDVVNIHVVTNEVPIYWEIWSLLGQKITSGLLNQTTTEIKTNYLLSGSYIFILYNNKEQKAIHKLLISH